MFYINAVPNEAGNHGNPCSNRADGMVALPEEMLTGYIGAMGFVNIEVSEGTVTRCTVNQEALDAYLAEHPADDPVEKAREEKLADISDACGALIVAGVDVTFREGDTEHFNLSIEDQSNINNLFRVVELGGTEFPYQADGGVCRVYTKEEIVAIYIAAQSLITGQTTYHNALKAWVQTMETREQIEAVTYGMELPAEYAAQVAEKMAVAQAQMEAILEHLGG